MTNNRVGPETPLQIKEVPNHIFGDNGQNRILLARIFLQFKSILGSQLEARKQERKGFAADSNKYKSAVAPQGSSARSGG